MHLLPWVSMTCVITAVRAMRFDWLNHAEPASPPTVLHARDHNTNGTQFLWLKEDVYAGTTFFDDFTFWNLTDPTHGLVTYLNASYAAETNLTSFTSEGKVIMKGDDTTTLPYGVNRSSVRITSNKQYNSGSLFILDIDRAPWGCGVWPSWWTVGDDWPWNGEIDIIEGVHGNEHNQVTWHTAPSEPGCNLTNVASNFTGSPVLVAGEPHLQCNASMDSNSGCGVIELSRASYGPYFDAQGGGVFAMKWDENSIAVWSFYRSAIPSDITAGNPDPSGWGMPVAELSPQGCNFTQYFHGHRIVFDITFCGDWAGNTYSTTDCPGTCVERLMDPTNFENASWIINSMMVYQKQQLVASATRSAAEQMLVHKPLTMALLAFGLATALSLYC